MRQSGALSEARVYRVGDLAEAMRTERTLRVRQVAADSVRDPAWEPANVFDHGGSPDGHTARASGDADSTHALAVVLEKPAGPSPSISPTAVAARTRCCWSFPRVTAN